MPHAGDGGGWRWRGRWTGWDDVIVDVDVMALASALPGPVTGQGAVVEVFRGAVRGLGRRGG